MEDMMNETRFNLLLTGEGGVALLGRTGRVDLQPAGDADPAPCLKAIQPRVHAAAKATANVDSISIRAPVAG
jgi:hypothetical protein